MPITLFAYAKLEYRSATMATWTQAQTRSGVTEKAYSAIIMDYNDLVLSLEYASRSVISHAVDLSVLCHMQKA